MNRKAPLPLDNETSGNNPIPKVKNKDTVGRSDSGDDAALDTKAPETGISGNMGNAVKFLEKETDRQGVNIGGYKVHESKTISSKE